MTYADLSRTYNLWKDGIWEPVESGVAEEKIVSLTVNGEIWLSFVCSPADLEAQAVGFLYNENVIQAIEDVVSVRVCPTGDNVDVWLASSVEKPISWIRSTNCTGGLASIPPASPVQALDESGHLLPEQVLDLVFKLFEAQEIYKQVGGTHTTALSDGKVIVLAAEDIGYQNTLDKIAGQMLLEKIRPDLVVLITTGRVSSEMMQKAVRMGAIFVITRTSPTSRSIEIADEMGVTLIGYARKERFTVYAHPERIASFDDSLQKSSSQKATTENSANRK